MHKDFLLGAFAAPTAIPVAISLCLPTGCHAQPGQWDSYGASSHVTCGTRPVLLTGNRQDLTVDGPCRYVRVAGRHNDISITLIPGGTIEITGAHNDVTWYLAPGSRLAPTLLDHGESNTFHKGE